MIDFRKLVGAELKRRGKTWYWLGRHDGVTCHEDTLRLWLLHDKNIGARYLGEILAVLGFRIVAPPKRRRRSRAA